MWKVNEALLLASDEREVLAAIGLCADQNASLQLFYINWLSQKPLDGFIVPVAAWDNGKLSSSQDLRSKSSIKDHADVNGFVAALAACPDPVWYAENVSVATGLTTLRFFQAAVRAWLQSSYRILDRLTQTHTTTGMLLFALSGQNPIRFPLKKGIALQQLHSLPVQWFQIIGCIRKL